ncbi:MAG: aminoacyl-tRNA hydrolase [Firmicutes bacterium]|nr:aminoacyl-tRNA hydrolase [Candidatus Caballimonas caccae]
MKLIVGLGNPEKKYFNTFHNLGFMCIDKVAEKLNVEFSKEKCRALICETRVNGEKVILAKPLTYMNLSGESVRELLDFYKMDVKDLAVLYDDLDLPKGTVRIREKGSSGTHNGMRNIVKEIGSENFFRVRVGFKQAETEHPIPIIDYVLSTIKDEEKEIFEKAIDKASNSAIDFIKQEDIQKIMQKYSG